MEIMFSRKSNAEGQSGRQRPSIQVALFNAKEKWKRFFVFVDTFVFQQYEILICRI